MTVRAEILAALMEGDLPDDIISIIEAVKFWEMNIHIEDDVERRIAEMRIKVFSKELKSAG